jgi:hypothetical protein
MKTKRWEVTFELEDAPLNGKDFMGKSEIISSLKVADFDNILYDPYVTIKKVRVRLLKDN